MRPGRQQRDMIVCHWQEPEAGPGREPEVVSLVRWDLDWLSVTRYLRDEEEAGEALACREQFVADSEPQ
jgi:hypothetical protein